MYQPGEKDARICGVSSRICARYAYLTLGAHAHEGYSNHFVCVCVCLEFAAFNSRLYIKYDIPFYFSAVFLGFKFCRF